VRLGLKGSAHDSGKGQDVPKVHKAAGERGHDARPRPGLSGRRREARQRASHARGERIRLERAIAAIRRRRRMRPRRDEHPGPESLGPAAGRGRVFGNGHEARAERLIMLGRSPPRAEHFKVGVPGHRRSANRPPSDREPFAPSRSRRPGSKFPPATGSTTTTTASDLHPSPLRRRAHHSAAVFFG
jgi:hypothetical protein